MVRPCTRCPPMAVSRICPAGGGFIVLGTRLDTSHFSEKRIEPWSPVTRSRLRARNRSGPWFVNGSKFDRRPRISRPTGRPRASMQRLADFLPLIGATGHGRVLSVSGPPLTAHLQKLIDRFGEDGVPKHGRYVRETWR